MMRDELLQHIHDLPAEADIGVQVGDGHLDITGVVPWGDGAFAALVCHREDLRDLLREWRLSTAVLDRAAIVSDSGLSLGAGQ